MIALPFSRLLSLQILLLLSTRSRSQDMILLSSCGNINYTTGSPYESNLRSLLTKLIFSTWNSSFFYTTNIGKSLDAQIFGLAQCRPDVSAANCIDCLNITANGCPLSKSAALRANQCVLRYSDQHFFSTVDMSQFESISNPENASNPVVFEHTVNDLMDKLFVEAFKAESKLGVGKANYSLIGDIYGMAWCTQDLSSGDCQQCLDRVGNLLPVEKLGARVMTVSCIARFEIFSFMPMSYVAPLAPIEGGSGDNRADAQSTDKFSGNNNNTTKMILIIALSVAFVLALLCVLFILLLRRKRALKRLLTGYLVQKESMRSIESLLFNLDTIIKATNNFSEENKLGEGGFGPVYKGLLEDGQLIAVKRLSRTSTQGFVEMKNEITLVVKLQHKNLVRLLGSCLEHNEKILVYEYLPKTSLDKYLFDPIERRKLDWRTRYKIIEGIGRGLLYLHEDSRLKIIHRDLKASNILLDSNIMPKISDFGIARLFNIDQTQQNTNQIAGTRGYMAPEYAYHGIFSTKSDVFSYGVLILEIITGRRNWVLTDIGHPFDLLSYVWKYWNQGTSLQMVDECLGHEYESQEVLRCLHIGLLCVQDDLLLRPSMASVMVMISSHSAMIPAPSTPPFYIGGSSYGDSGLSVRETEHNL